MNRRYFLKSGSIALATVGMSLSAPSFLERVVMGNALQTSTDAIYGARHVGLKAGVPKEKGALTVNRLCGSGIQSIVNAAQMIQLGEAVSVLAGECGLIDDLEGTGRSHPDGNHFQCLPAAERILFVWHDSRSPSLE